MRRRATTWSFSLRASRQVNAGSIPVGIGIETHFVLEREVEAPEPMVKSENGNRSRSCEIGDGDADSAIGRRRRFAAACSERRFDWTGFKVTGAIALALAVATTPQAQPPLLALAQVDPRSTWTSVVEGHLIGGATGFALMALTFLVNVLRHHVEAGNR